MHGSGIHLSKHLIFLSKCLNCLLLKTDISVVKSLHICDDYLKLSREWKGCCQHNEMNE